MDLFEKIQDLCDRDDVSFRKLERELGFGNGTITKWKNGGAPNIIDKLQQIANYFNVPITYFFDDNITDESNTDLLVDVLGDNELLEYVRKLQSLNDEHKEKIYHDIDYWHAIEQHN